MVTLVTSLKLCRGVLEMISTCVSSSTQPTAFAENTQSDMITILACTAELRKIKLTIIIIHLKLLAFLMFLPLMIFLRLRTSLDNLSLSASFSFSLTLLASYSSNSMCCRIQSKTLLGTNLPLILTRLSATYFLQPYASLWSHILFVFFMK